MTEQGVDGALLGLTQLTGEGHVDIGGLVREDAGARAESRFGQHVHRLVEKATG